MAPERGLGGRSGASAQGTVTALATRSSRSPQRSAVSSASPLARLVDGQLALARCEPDPDKLHALLARLACELLDADGAFVEHVVDDERASVAEYGNTNSAESVVSVPLRQDQVAGAVLNVVSWRAHAFDDD